MNKKMTKPNPSSARMKVLTNIRAVSPLVSLLEIRLIRARFSHLDMNQIDQIDGKKLDDISLQGKQSSRILGSLEQIRESKKLTIESRFSLYSYWQADEKKKATIYNVEASFQMVYQLRIEGNDKLTIKALTDFANVNGIINVWPYWRELAHSLVSKAGLFSSSPVPTITADRLLPPAKNKS